MSTIYRMLGIGLLVGLLVLVRFFEHRLFYDPFISFFQAGYLHNETPQFEMGKLLVHLSFRFWINTAISLLILYVAFLDRNIIRFSFILYSILFVVCMLLFVFLVVNLQNDHFLALFYVRRFLIQPIFVIILLPAFYYYRLLQRNGGNAEKFSGEKREIS